MIKSSRGRAKYDQIHLETNLPWPDLNNAKFKLSISSRSKGNFQLQCFSIWHPGNRFPSNDYHFCFHTTCFPLGAYRMRGMIFYPLARLIHKGQQSRNELLIKLLLRHFKSKGDDVLCLKNNIVFVPLSLKASPNN